MNINLINNIWDYNEKFRFGAIAASLYIYLIYKSEQSGNLEFKLSDTEVSNRVGLSKKTIKASREKLRNIGLIQYQSVNGIATYYKIIETPQWGFTKTPNKINKDKESQKQSSEIDFPEKEIESEKPSISSEKVNVAKNIPEYSEFLSFAKSLKNYNTTLDDKIEAKYDSWVENGWKNGFDRPITNWKSSLKNTLPYLAEGVPQASTKLPTINRPKSTYNE